MKGTCGTCAWFAALQKECRAEAPKPFPVMGPQGPAGVMGIWPATTADGWCRVYQQELRTGVEEMVAPASTFARRAN